MLTPQHLARLARLEPAEVEEAEKTGEVSLQVLVGLSTALGGSLDDLLEGRKFWQAPALALKTTSEVERAELTRGLSRVVSAIRDHRELAKLLGKPDLWAKRGHKLGPCAVQGSVVKQAERLAKKVRRVLGWPLAPISSVREVLATFGVVTFFSEFADEGIDGAMLRFADSAPYVVMAASSARRGLTTAVRMALAHELCHALFDRPKVGVIGRVEYVGQEGDPIEQRANAFAAHLLAPRMGVRRWLKDQGATEKPTGQQVLALSLHFGMGVQAMAYHLVHLGFWEEADVQRHASLRSPSFASNDDRELRETPGESKVPLERRGALLDLATEALESGRISSGRWRELLKCLDEGAERLLMEERQLSLPGEFYVEVG
jgi:Zn-dependent peptidase ImmA (M78 family)